MLKNTHILLGVTGGIAAYKSVELLRLLKKAGADVQVVLTASAQNFVGKTTFEVLSENPVIADLFKDTGSSVAHIDAAAKTDLAVVAPATANIIAKLANGLADDALSTTMLAVTAPVMLCPSMNSDMYQNIRVQRNLDILEKDGVHILDPDSGVLACKTVGAGRLPEPEYIFDRICALLTPKDLKGKRFLISAGPTREALDPVRYISNHSSGKMGYAIAGRAEKRGGQVTLVSGPVSIDPPFGIDLIKVSSGDDMAAAMLDNLSCADIIIKVAAVADFKPDACQALKIKKKPGQKGMVLSLTENMDILNRLGELKTKEQFLAGFAAETHDLEENALKKMKKKNLDMIVANLVGQEGSGFEADTNKARVFLKNGTVKDIPLMEKLQVADIVLDTIVQELG